MYEGLWKDNSKEGEGVLVYFNGDVFHGKWENDIVKGENCFMLYKNGDTFQGEYRAGVRVGLGKYIFENGQTIEAEWFGDLHARGTITYTNGDIYEGEIYRSQK